MSQKLYKNYIACSAAGSGKTYRIATFVAENRDRRILCLTYTRRNQRELRSAIVEQCGEFPSHVEVMGWDVFLLRRMIRPYARPFLPSIPKSFDFSHDAQLEATVLRRYNSSDHRRFMSSGGLAYRATSAKLVLILASKAGGTRLYDEAVRAYDTIALDEFQDTGGYELDIIASLANTKAQIILSGDIRQSVYKTHRSNKAKNYDGSARMDWIEEQCSEGRFTLETVVTCRRCPQAVCSLADRLYPKMPTTRSIATSANLTPCLWQVHPKYIFSFICRFHPVVLHSKRAKDREQYQPVNFGVSKGATYENTLIFLPDTAITALMNNAPDTIGAVSRAKAYVAITRSKGHVGFVTAKDLRNIGFTKYEAD